ncbi:hypothetical protein KSP40_PGU014102 [Platanthera guangdongensis]|uniref:Uncharacterized protein n=1 Tax=Platanthera guangdongensis TaxID=2320717 RepID=A0ABR2MR80_9ASPA
MGLPCRRNSLWSNRRFRCWSDDLHVAHAASAKINSIENCTPDTLSPYLDDIISILLMLFFYFFQNGKQMVQEGALAALASIADSSQAFRSIASTASLCSFDVYLQIIVL